MKYFIVLICMFLCFSICSIEFKLDTDEDKKIDRIIQVEVYKDWKLLDRNGNDKPDESCLYMKDSIVYLIKSEVVDYNNDGKNDIWITITPKGKSFFKEIKIDSNNDGKIDLIRYEENDFVYLQKMDENLDGKFDKIEEYNVGGIVTKEGVDKIVPDESNFDFFEKEILEKLIPPYRTALLTYYKKDSSVKKYIVRDNLKPDEKKKLTEIFFTLGYGDEKMDVYYYFTNSGAVEKEEHDTNNDGKPDMWVKYAFNVDASLKEVIIEKDNNFDGKADEWHFTDKNRRIKKVEKDTNFDGKTDSVKNY